jgi:hypothetical protein
MADLSVFDWIKISACLALSATAFVLLWRSIREPEDREYDRRRAESRANEEKLARALDELDEVKRR